MPRAEATTPISYSAQISNRTLGELLPPLSPEQEGWYEDRFRDIKCNEREAAGMIWADQGEPIGEDHPTQSPGQES